MKEPKLSGCPDLAQWVKESQTQPEKKSAKSGLELNDRLILAGDRSAKNENRTGHRSRLSSIVDGLNTDQVDTGMKFSLSLRLRLTDGVGLHADLTSYLRLRGVSSLQSMGSSGFSFDRSRSRKGKLKLGVPRLMHRFG
jgi:hypothetical protein